MRVCEQSCDITQILIGYVVRCAFWLASRKYEHVLRKNILIKKIDNIFLQ